MEWWKNTDPRLDINKRAEIVILRPSLTGVLEASIGYVDTKEEYYIRTGFDTHKFILADEDWDSAWFWCRMPERKL